MCVCVYVSVETIWNVVAFYTSGGSFRMTLRSDMSRSWAEDAIASDGKASELLQKLRLSRRSEKRRRKTKDEDEGDVFLLNLPKYPPFCVFSKNSQNAPPTQCTSRHQHPRMLWQDLVIYNCMWPCLNLSSGDPNGRESGPKMHLYVCGSQSLASIAG